MSTAPPVTGTAGDPAGEPARTAALPGVPLTTRLIGAEIACVLALSLAAAAVGSTISFVGALTAPESLAEQTATLIPAQADVERPWLDLSRQIYALLFALVPVFLVVYLLHRSRESAATIGFDVRRPGLDWGGGALLAALIGVGGLAVYLVSVQAGLNRPIAPSTLNGHWWEVPILLGQAVKNGVLEEVIVVGYLMHRFGQLGRLRGWSPARAAVVATALSATLRAFYHLYQGAGMFLGNLVMGVVFCWFYHRYGRVMPLVVAHCLIDVVAFLGALYLLGAVSWLP